jgi:hypothetical protein
MSTVPSMVVTGCSSRYVPTVGWEAEWLPSCPLTTPRMYMCVVPMPVPPCPRPLTVVTPERYLT